MARRLSQPISRRLRLVSRRPVCGSSRVSPGTPSHPHAAWRPFPHHAARDRVRGAWSSRPTKCPAQGGAGSKRSMLGCDPGAGHKRAFMRRTGAHLRGRIPASGARRRAEEGPLWGSDPADAHGIGFDTTRSRSAPRSHPASGSLLHAAARRRFWLQPFGLARVLAHDFVAPLANIRDIGCRKLRVLSQNRDSASRVS